jgi:phosphate uptake regulator
MTKHIERQIESLKERILRLGTLVEEAISKSITALINRETALAQRVMAVAAHALTRHQSQQEVKANKADSSQSKAPQAAQPEALRSRDRWHQGVVR